MVNGIDLSNNDLSGSLPENISFSFPKLSYLNMARNKLEVHIPMSLGHAPLSFIDLIDNNFSEKLPHSFMKNHTNL